MKTNRLTFIAVFIILFFSSAAYCAIKTKTTLLAEMDFFELNDSKNYFGVSPDNRSVFYENYEDERHTIFVNGRKLTDKDVLGWNYPFSPDGKRTAILCLNEIGFNFAVTDGEEVRLKDTIMKITFSPDCKNVAYSFYTKEKGGISLDGKEAELYYSIGEPVFIKRENKNILVYAARSDDRWALFIDGEKKRTYDGIREVAASPDGKRLAIEALEGGKGFVVVDGKEGKRYDDNDQDDSSIIFSPDSKHIAYIAGKFGAEFVVLDDTEHKKYKYIASGDRTLIFSPDSKHLAYVGVIDSGKCAFVLDGNPQKIYRSINTYDPPVFSADGRLAYAAQIEDKKECIVLDGKEQTIYDYVGNPVFSADGKHFAYTATKGENNFVVLDGKEQKKYKQVDMLTLSSDGKHYAYAAREGENFGELFVVIDGIEYREDGFIIPDRSERVRIVFDGLRKLHFLAQKDKKIYLVEKELE